MYNGQLKSVDGSYTQLNFIKRCLQLFAYKNFLHYQRIYNPEWGRVTRILVFFDCLWCLLRYGAIYSDYFEYKFVEKSHYSRRTYVTKGKSRKIQKIFNRAGARCMFDKLTFNREYAQFRTLKDFEFSSSKKDFIKFVKDCNRQIIAKPFFGYSGNGIFIPDVSTDERASDLYDALLKDGNYFCEELFIQTGVLHDINPSSVNTVRIYTLHDGVNVHIMGTYARIGGKNSIVDNIHGGGVCCTIDKETGIITSLGEDLKGNHVLFHPATGTLIPGNHIPQWSVIIDMVKKAANIHPEVGYTGWDFAVSDNAVCIIEANEQGNFNLPQTAMGRGVLPDYNAILKGMSKHII